MLNQKQRRVSLSPRELVTLQRGKEALLMEKNKQKIKRNQETSKVLKNNINRRNTDNYNLWDTMYKLAKISTGATQL